MNWNELYPQMIKPDLSTVSEYIDSPLWDDLLCHIEETYNVFPTMDHSVCSGAAGWNLKYKKSSRALCTLYPGEGFFTCLVSIGRKEAAETEALMTTFTDYIQQLYWNTRLFNGGRWLMINVTSPEILADTKQLIALRMKKRK